MRTAKAISDLRVKMSQQNTSVVIRQRGHWGKKAYIVIAVTVGLLCVLQAVLNISLRLSLTCSRGTEEISKNVTNEAELRNVTDEVKLKNMTNDGNLKKMANKRDELMQKMEKYDGWQYFHGSLYYLSTTTANWQESRNDCLSKGADLVVINDAVENDFARGLGRRIWLGLYKNGSSWRWVDGSYLTISFWGEGEPNDSDGREDRVEIAKYYQANSWNDISWEASYHWICEYNIF